MTPELIRYADADAVAAGMAERLIASLAELQAAGRTPQVALTGGRIATRVYRQLATDEAATAVDWSNLDLWWGDERWVPAADSDRNAKLALDAFGDLLGLDPARIHPMPASDGDVDLDSAARAYAEELGQTTFDICLLGMGPDGHIASLFPDHAWATATGSVIPVRNSPKPPQERISLTLEAINRSREIWFCVSGADKADAAAQVLSGHANLPAAAASGTERTVWLIDQDAAAKLG